MAYQMKLNVLFKETKMKNKFQTILLILTILSFAEYRAQVIVPLNTNMENILPDSYVKDLNNELDTYIGIYKANYEGKEVTLFISKKENMPTKRMNKNFFRDVLDVKYKIVHSTGLILQDTQNLNNPSIELQSVRTNSAQNQVLFSYSGVACHVGWGKVIMKKISPSQISWDYRPNSMVTDHTCPPTADTTVHLPVTNNLIFTKQ